MWKLLIDWLTDWLTDWLIAPPATHQSDQISVQNDALQVGCRTYEAMRNRRKQPLCAICARCDPLCVTDRHWRAPARPRVDIHPVHQSTKRIYFTDCHSTSHGGLYWALYNCKCTVCLLIIFIRHINGTGRNRKKLRLQILCINNTNSSIRSM